MNDKARSGGNPITAFIYTIIGILVGIWSIKIFVMVGINLLALAALIKYLLS